MHRHRPLPSAQGIECDLRDGACAFEVRGRLIAEVAEQQGRGGADLIVLRIGHGDPARAASRSAFQSRASGAISDGHCTDQNSAGPRITER